MALVEYGRALYYPYIHLRDELWLKTAALYYDKLARIVPFDFTPHDTGAAEALHKELGFFEEIDPRQEADRLAPEFITFAREYLASDSPRGVWASVRGRIWKRKTLSPSLVTSLGSFSGSEPFRIHPSKMAQELGAELTKLGLAKKADDYYGDFDLEPVTGALYMIFLAKTMAGERSLSVVTDNPAYQPLIHQPLSLGIQPGISEAKMDKGFVLASFAIQSVAPKDLNSVTIDQIISFREKHDAERRSFRGKVIDLAKDLDKVDHPEAIRDYLNDKQKIINDGVKSLEDGLRSVNIDCVRNLFALSVPAWVGASWAVPLIAANPVIIPGAVVLATSFALAKWGVDRKKAKSASQYSYVLSLKRNLEIGAFMKQLQCGQILT